MIVRRLPAQGKGRGTAQNYIVGTSNADQVGDHRIEASAKEEMRLKMARGQANGRGGFQSMTKRFDGKDEKKVGLSRAWQCFNGLLLPVVLVKKCTDK